MVKLLYQFAVKLCLDDVDVELVVVVGQSILTLKTIAQILEKIYVNLGFVAELNK